MKDVTRFLVIASIMNKRIHLKTYDRKTLIRKGAVLEFNCL